MKIGVYKGSREVMRSTERSANFLHVTTDEDLGRSGCSAARGSSSSESVPGTFTTTLTIYHMPIPTTVPCSFSIRSDNLQESGSSTHHLNNCLQPSLLRYYIGDRRLVIRVPSWITAELDYSLIFILRCF